MAPPATSWRFASGPIEQSGARLRHCVFPAGLAALVCLLFGWNAPVYAADSDLLEQRDAYKRAVASIRAGQTQQYKRYAAKLKDYALQPYLEYHALNARLSRAGDREVLAFLQGYDLPVVPILRQRWLKRLGQQRRWTTLLEHFEGTRDPELHCYYLRALYGTGQKELALASTADAWAKADSQPEACDPLFDVWRQTDHFTEEVAWRRLGLALSQNEVTLARYLQRYFKEHEQAARAYYDVHVRPERLRRTSTYRIKSPEYRELVRHGLERLARRKPETAAELWPKYRSNLGFSEGEQVQIEHMLVAASAAEGTFPALSERATVTQPDTQLALAEYAARSLRWDEVIYWSERLNEEHQAQAQVQYFLARALALSTGDQTRANLALQALAGERQYYGFWAAQQLGLSGVLNARPVNTSGANKARVAAQANISRSLELFAVDDRLNARREWFAGLGQMAAQDQVIAAQLALDNGLLQLAIQTANRADAHDALTLRFPTAFEPQFRQAALKTGLPAPLLMAVARQESALDHQARSHANARGLMQLLPTTASLVARRSLLPSPSLSDLYDPGKNILLGSHHLAWLMARYDQQQALAVAAYNAGEHRVDRWIKDAQNMPLDVWIETIPFRETRNYVKNVLAFQHVYAQLMNQPLPFVGHEQLTVQPRS